MAKKKQSLPKPPTVSELVSQLQQAGGEVNPWYDLPAANYLKTLRKAIKDRKVELTIDGGVRLITEEYNNAES